MSYEARIDDLAGPMATNGKGRKTASRSAAGFWACLDCYQRLGLRLTWSQVTVFFLLAVGQALAAIIGIDLLFAWYSQGPLLSAKNSFPTLFIILLFNVFIVTLLMREIYSQRLFSYYANDTGLLYLKAAFEQGVALNGKTGGGATFGQIADAFICEPELDFQSLSIQAMRLQINLITAAAWFILSVGAIATLGVHEVWTSLVVIIIHMGLYEYYRPAFEKTSRRLARRHARLLSFVHDAFKNRHEIARLAIQGNRRRVARSLIDRLAQAKKDSEQLFGAFGNWSLVFSGIAFSFIIINYKNDSMSSQLMVLCAISVVACIDYWRHIGPVIANATLLGKLIPAHKGWEMITAPEAQEENVVIPDCEKLHARIQKAHLLLHQVRCRHVNQNSYLLEEISFSLDQGNFAVLVGENGSGKTSLLQLIARNRVDWDGWIFFEGRDLNAYADEEIRHGITMIPAEPNLFPGTLEDNLKLRYPDASEDTLWEAVRLVGLDRLITQLPMRFATVVDGDGVMTLDSQKDTRRILTRDEAMAMILARAILNPGSLVLIDDPNFSMHSHYRRRFESLLESLKGWKTVVLATQNPAYVRKANQILSLSNRRIQQFNSEEATR